jgi:hypothetical protein
MSLTWLLFAETPPTATSPDRELRGMGSPTKVREQISDGLGNAVVWYKDGCGQYGEDGCMIEFHVPEDEDSVVCVMIHVRGLGAAERLLTLAHQNDWCLVDDSLSPIAGS